MKSNKTQVRKHHVSFTTFRLLQLEAVRTMWSNLDHNGGSDDSLLFAWACIQALQEGRFADAVELSRRVAEQQYATAEAFRSAAQFVALVKKCPFRDPLLDPEGAATEKFLAAEEHCRATNVVLRDLRLFYDGELSNASLDADSTAMVELLLRARKHFRRALGNKPPLQALLSGARFGPGASRGVGGDATHLLRKLTTEKWTVSRLAAPYAFAACAADPSIWYALGLDPSKAKHLWADPMMFYSSVPGVFSAPCQDVVLAEFREAWRRRVEFTETDQINYVLKDADCHRTVGTQPLLNGYVQNGIGDWLTQNVLLRKCGIDLSRDQETRNGPLASLGSFCDGTTVCTIDLKSASDTNARELVRFLATDEWWTVLNATASKEFVFPGEKTPRKYEKLCAMGNGFCFPLETLIFWSLVQAVYDVVEIPDRLCAVYGDDIIVYQPAALLLIELLEVAGFDTNTSKTFVHGPFRESCGQDYFNGINVRPVILDEVIEGLGQAYHLINSLQRKGYTFLAERMRAILADRCGSGNLHYRPFPGVTTTALEVPWDTFMASRHARNHLEPPLDERKPWYQSWSWVELLELATNDNAEYSDRVHLSAALSGAASASGVPVFALRRKTSVRVRRVAHA